MSPNTKKRVKVGDWVTYPSFQGGNKIRWGKVLEVLDGRVARIQFVTLFHELATRPDGSAMTIDQDLSTILEVHSGPPSWYQEGVSLIDKCRRPREFGHLF